MATTCVSSRACSGCATEGSQRSSGSRRRSARPPGSPWVSGTKRAARRQSPSGTALGAGRPAPRARWTDRRERDARRGSAPPARRDSSAVGRRRPVAAPRAPGVAAGGWLRRCFGTGLPAHLHGARLMATLLAEQAAAHAVPSGRPVGCQREDIERARGANPPGRLWLIQAVSATTVPGVWCTFISTTRRATTSSFGRPIRSDSSPPSQRRRWPDMSALQWRREASGSRQQTGRKWATPPVRSSASGRFARTVGLAPFRPFPA